MGVTRAALASTISAVTGLDYQVAMNWLNAENSVAGKGTNPLGILCGNSRGSGLEVGCDGRFAIYRSSTEGARAAGWLLLHGPYAGVRQAIATGTPQAQRAAIVRSPWAFGNYHGGTGFSAAGISGTAPANAGPSGGGASRAPTARLVSAPVAGAKPSSTGAPAPDSSGFYTLATFLGHDGTITGANAREVVKEVGAAVQAAEASGTISHAWGQALVDLVGGKAVGLRFGGTGQKFSAIHLDPATGGSGSFTGDVLPDIQKAVITLLVNGAILVVIIGLGAAGVKKILG